MKARTTVSSALALLGGMTLVAASAEPLPKRAPVEHHVTIGFANGRPTVSPETFHVKRRDHVVWHDSTAAGGGGGFVIHFEKGWMFGWQSARDSAGIRPAGASGRARRTVGISTPAIGHKYDVTVTDSQGNPIGEPLDPEIDCC
jgi:hypothetical protein